MIKLFHSTNVLFSKVELGKCNQYKDFGQAFYLTEDRKQAVEIASARVDIFGGTPIINEYDFDESLIRNGELSCKKFDKYDEEWAEFIYNNRDETLCPPFNHSYDVVYGPIANDRVGLQIRNFRQGNIDKKEFLRRLKYMKGITFQYAFCMLKAIEKLIRK